LLSELFVELVGKLAEGKASDKQTTEGRQVCVANNAEGVEWKNPRKLQTTEIVVRTPIRTSYGIWYIIQQKKELRKWYIDQARIRGINIPIQELKI